MSAESAKPTSEVALGRRIRSLRAAKNLTLEQTSQASGLARSTLSKIENGQMSPTYDALLKLATGLDVDLTELFTVRREAVGVGRRSVCRDGSGSVHDTPYYEHMLLCNDLSNKDMVPFKTKVVARNFDDFDDWSRHVGEEFVYVLSGKIKLFTEFYEPVELAPGDCWYIDSRMGHRIISVSEDAAVVLWVSTTNPKNTQNIPSVI